MQSGISAVRARMAWTPQSAAEEFASASVHGIGAVLAAAATVILVERALPTASAVAVLSCAGFGLAAFATFLSSALFHSRPPGAARAKWLARDHCAIFAMIAATYTPILLLAFPHPLGVTLTAIQWLLAAAGIATRIRLGRLHWTMIPILLAMGWAGFLWSGTMFAGIGAVGGGLLLAGGLAYTGGLVFYLWRTLPFNHAIWHACVVAGAACHFFAIALHVLPRVG